MEHNLQNYAVGYIINTMERRRIPQKELANILGLSKQTVSNYLTNKSKFTLHVLEDFLSALGLPVSALVNDYENRFLTGGQSLAVSGNENLTNLAGGNITTGSDKLQTENTYLKQLIKEKDEQIKLLRELLGK